MKNQKSYLIGIVFSTAMLTGCAPMISGAMNAALSEESILEKTASYFGAAPGKVTVWDTKSDLLTTSYKARYASKAYNCSIYYGEVKCTLLGSASDFSPAEKNIEKSKADMGLDVNASVEMTVSQAQKRLNELGYPVGKPDGIFGKMTAQKVKEFQKSHGLRVTGVLDAPTKNALK